ncbi:hypothetical protein [Streptomyces sp. NPDC055189]
MSLERVTITIPSESLEAAASAAEREGLSVSAWLSRAAERAAKDGAGRTAGREAMKHVKPPTPEEQERVDSFMRHAIRPVSADDRSRGAA